MKKYNYLIVFFIMFIFVISDCFADGTIQVYPNTSSTVTTKETVFTLKAKVSGSVEWVRFYLHGDDNASGLNLSTWWKSDGFWYYSTDSTRDSSGYYGATWNMTAIPNTRYSTMIWIKYSDRIDYEPGGRVYFYAKHCEWRTGSYGNCDTDCGNGHRTRTVVCRNKNGYGDVVADKDCGGSKPDSRTSCSVNCDWKIGSWSSCSNDCGNGTKTRSVQCKNEYGKIISSYKCPGSEPDRSRSCTGDGSNCYRWDTGSWSSCSNKCGNGTQTRNVYCKHKYSGNTVNGNKCPGSEPDRSRSCSGDSSDCYKWHTGSWSSCKANNSCGKGTKTRYVQCRDIYGKIVSDSKCLEAKPDSSMTCNATSGCRAPEATITSINPNIAIISESIEFIGTGKDTDGGSIQLYEWKSNLDGNLSNNSRFSKSDLSIGTHTISLRVKDDEGVWSNTKTSLLTIKQKTCPEPTAQFNMDKNSGYAPLNVSFENQSNAGGSEKIQSLEWDFGDDNRATGNKVNNIFQDQGEYTVSLTVTNSCGKKNSIEKKIKVLNSNVKGYVDPKGGEIGSTFSWSAIFSGNMDNNLIAKLELVSPVDNQSKEWNMKDVQGQKGAFYISNPLNQIGEYKWRIIIERSGKDNIYSDYSTVNVTPANPMDDYPYKNEKSKCHEGNKFCTPDPWLFCKHNCTSWVAWKVNQAAGITNPSDNNQIFHNYITQPRLSHAKNWADRLSALVTVDNDPKPGSIAHWNAASWNLNLGHVAYVHSINPDGSVVISEYNYPSACRFNTRTVGGKNASKMNKPDNYIHVEAIGFGGGGDYNAIVVDTYIHEVNNSSGKVNFDINYDGEWKAETKNDWLNITKNNDAINVDFDKNSGDARVGKIEIIADEAVNSPVILEVKQTKNEQNDFLVFPENPTSNDLIKISLSSWLGSPCDAYETSHEIDGNNIRIDINSSQKEGVICIQVVQKINITQEIGSLKAGIYTVSTYRNNNLFQTFDFEVSKDDNTVLLEEYDGNIIGDEYGVEYVDTLHGKGVKFSRVKESRIQYPFDKWMVKQGTLEFLIKIESGYDYQDKTYRGNPVLYEGNKHALLFTTDVQHGDVYWPGSTWFYVRDNGVLSLSMATIKGTGRGVQSISSKETEFKFNQWHYVGISFGSEGQYIMVNGKEVASNTNHKQILGSGGTHSSPVDKPTIGESLPGFWKNNHWEGGFEGVVDRFRISKKQRDWKLCKQEPDYRIELSSKDVQFESEGGEISVNVNSNSKWNVVSNIDWLTIYSSMDGFIINCKENYGEERSGTISVISSQNQSISQTVSISQMKYDNQNDSHYIPVWTGNPYNPMNLWIKTESIDELNLLSGDEIGIFDGDVCVGAAVIKDDFEDDMIVIVTSENDGTDNGFTTGNQISFRIWYSNEEIENKNINAKFFELTEGNQIFDDTFKGNDDRAVELTDAIVNQVISLKSGWNIFSLYVMPEVKDFVSVLKSLIDDKLLEKVIDEQGNRVIFSAFSNDWINQIGEINDSEGYQIKVNSNTELNINGIMTQMPKTIELSKGWNVISYPCYEPQNALYVVSSLIENEILDKIIDESGNRIIYSAFTKNWINQIGNFIPGKGYIIKVSDDSEITFNVPKVNKSRKKIISKSNSSGELSSKHCKPEWDGHPYNSMKVWIIDVENFEIDKGDEICVLDGEKCVGVGIADGKISLQNILTITTSQDDGSGNGFTVTHPIKFKLWDNSEQKEVNIEKITFLSLETAQIIESNPGFEGNKDIAVKLSIDNSVSPIIVTPVQDVIVDQDSDDTIIDLSQVFNDPDNNNDEIIKSVNSNTNEKLVNAEINDNNLILSFKSGQFGVATIEILAVSNGKRATDNFIVTVSKVEKDIIAKMKLPEEINLIKGTKLISMSISVSNPDNVVIDAIDTAISFDKNVISPNNVSLSKELEDIYSIKFNTKISGEIDISITPKSGLTDLNQLIPVSGSICDIEFNVTGNYGDTTDITFQDSVLNETSVPYENGTLNIINTPPEIDDIPDQIANINLNKHVIINISDVDTELDILDINVSVSNNDLIKEINIQGNGNKRELIIAPVKDVYGKTEVTVDVSDESTKITKSFMLTINNISLNVDTNCITTYPGEILILPVDISSDIDLENIYLQTKYDNTVLTPSTQSISLTGSIFEAKEYSLTKNINQINLYIDSSEDPVKSDGSLVNLIFNVNDNAKIGEKINIEIVNALVNGIKTYAPSGCVQISGVVVSGKVIYRKNDKPVSKVTIEVSGDGEYSILSNEAGQYSLYGIRPGQYELSAFRNDKVEYDLSALDVTWIRQYVIKNRTFNWDEIIAGDVSLNGTLQSYDAAKVLYKAVDIEPCLNKLCKKWVFIPEAPSNIDNWDDGIVYPSQKTINLTSNLSNLNFTAIYLGDVSGNWEETTTKKRLKKSKKLISSKIRIKKDEVLTIPVCINNFVEIGGIDLVVKLSDGIIPVGASLENSELSYCDYKISSNKRINGKLKVLIYSWGNTCTTSGNIAFLSFKAINSGRISIVQFDNNEKNADGGLLVDGIPAGIVEIVVE